jgi:hypothetical protein
MPCAMLLTYVVVVFLAQKLGHCTLVSALPSMSRVLTSDLSFHVGTSRERLLESQSGNFLAARCT